MSQTLLEILDRQGKRSSRSSEVAREEVALLSLVLSLQ